MPFTRINLVKCTNQNPQDSCTVVYLPGGPGLSSFTGENLIPLKSDFDVALVDPPGTGTASMPPRFSYPFVLEDMENALKEINRPMILVGHSFGGIQAIDLLLRGNLNVVGLVCLASPILAQTFVERTNIFNRLATQEILRGKGNFMEAPTQRHFDEYLGVLAPLYFSPPFVDSGREWLARDKTSVALFMGSFEEGERGYGLLKKLASLTLPKVFLAGSLDSLYPPSSLRHEIALGGFSSQIVEGAGHFLQFEVPEICMNAIRSAIPTSIQV